MAPPERPGLGLIQDLPEGVYYTGPHTEPRGMISRLLMCFSRIAERIAWAFHRKDR